MFNPPRLFAPLAIILGLFLIQQKCSNYCRDNRPFERIYTYYGITDGDTCRCATRKPQQEVNPYDCDKPCGKINEDIDEWCGELD